LLLVLKEYFDSLKEQIVEDFNKSVSEEKLKVKELSVFTQNAKMKKSSEEDVVIYNFGIPAFLSQSGIKTCPNAGNCAAGCYARSGTFLWNNVQGAYERRLLLTQHSLFAEVIMFEVDKLISKAKGKKVLLRIHDSGDFYSEEYQKMWYDIAESYSSRPDVLFYAYTKSVSQTKALDSIKPANFEIIFSLGGKEDHLIDQANDRHSKVFEEDSELEQEGYINATDDDKKAIGANKKIGLVYHGAKGFGKTNWNKV